MGNYETLKKSITSVIKQNGNQEITGLLLQNTLLTIISTVGENATFAGIATPDTNPGTPDQNVFYLAVQNGLYTYFNGAVIGDNTTVIFQNKKGNWTKTVLGVATSEEVALLRNNTESFIPFSVLGRYVKADGTFADNQYWKTTYYEPVMAGTYYELKVYSQEDVSLIAFYDENKVFISSIPGVVVGYNKINGIVPDNAKYCIVSTAISNMFPDVYLYLDYRIKGIFNYLRNEGAPLYLVNTMWKNNILVRRQVGTGYDSLRLITSANYDDTYGTTVFLYYADRTNYAPVVIDALLQHGSYLVLSKKKDSFVPFTSMDDLPKNKEYIYTYVFTEATLPTNIPAWTIIARCLMGELLIYLPNNIKYLSNSDIVNSNEVAQSFPFANQGYIKADGTIVSTPYWLYTDLIPVLPGLKYEGAVMGQYSNGVQTALLCLYDKNKKLISTIPAISAGKNMTSLQDFIPDDVYYVRACTAASGWELKSYFAVFYQMNKIIEEINKKSTIQSNAVLKYGHNLQKKYYFEGAKAAFFGDSVTVGVASNPFGQITESYRRIFSDLAGFSNSTNYAISGSGFTEIEHTPAVTSITTQITNIIDSNVDFEFIFIAGGINDYYRQQPLGSLGDTTNATFYGGLDVVCKHLTQTIPDRQIIFITPLNDSRPIDKADVVPLNAYRNAIFEVATMAGFSVVDTSVIGFPNVSDPQAYKDAMIQDGVHPTAAGHRLYAHNLYSILT